MPFETWFLIDLVIAIAGSIALAIAFGATTPGPWLCCVVPSSPKAAARTPASSARRHLTGLGLDNLGTLCGSPSPPKISSRIREGFARTSGLVRPAQFNLPAFGECQAI
jgi:hypothetical protein